MTPTKLVFYVKHGDVQTSTREIEIRNQPLSHEADRILDAIGRELSDLRQLARKEKGKKK